MFWTHESAKFEYALSAAALINVRKYWKPIQVEILYFHCYNHKSDVCQNLYHINSLYLTQLIMGVTGLWSILDSIGHPIKLDALEGKKLGVDANLWLYKFIRGFRDKDNATNVDSHKLGLFNRISKLLFYKIKPIFVFDGPAPVLKRRTLERRQNLRGKQLEKSQEAAIKLFKEELKRHYPNADVNSIDVTLPHLSSHLLTAAEKMTDDDQQLFYVPPEMPILIEDEELDESDIEVDAVIDKHVKIEEDVKDIKFKRTKSNDIDVDSPEFNSLPPEVRYEVLKDVKESRRKIRRAGPLPEDSDSFSKLQLNRLMTRRSIQEKIEKCEKDICSMYGMDLMDSKDQRVEHFRVQSNANSNMLFITNNPTINEQPKPKLPTEDDDIDTSFASDEHSFERSFDQDTKDKQQTAKIILPKRPIRSQLINEEPSPIYIFKNRTRSITSNRSNDLSQDSNIELKAPCLSRTPSPEPCTPKKQKTTSPEIITIEPTPEQQPQSKSSLDLAAKQPEKISFPPTTMLLTDESEDDASESNKSPELIALTQTPANKNDQVEPHEESQQAPESPEVISICSSTSPDVRLPKFNLDSTTWDTDSDSDWTDTEPTSKIVTPPRMSLSQPASFKPSSSITENPKQISIGDRMDLDKPSSQPMSIQSDEQKVIQKLISSDNYDNNLRQSTSVQSTNTAISASQPQATTTISASQDDNRLRLSHEETRQILSEKNKTDRQTNKVTTKIIEEAKELLRLFGVPFIEAAGEAEAQCAILEALGHTEGTITDDSDIWLFGAQKVYRHFFSDDKYVMEYKMSEIIHHVRMSRENLICLAMLVGSDYTDGVMNVGPVTALEILSEFQGDDMDPLVKFREWRDNYAKEQALINATKDGLSKKGRKVGNKKRETFLKFRLPHEFPSRAVYDGYMKPMADTSEDKFTWGLPDLDELREYARRQFDWDRKKIDDKLLPVMKKLSEKKTQSTIDSFFFKTPANENPELFRSKRVNQALSKIAKTDTVTEPAATSKTDKADEPKLQPAIRKTSKAKPKTKSGARGKKSAKTSKLPRNSEPACANLSEESD